jgi:hypothetical protein
VTLLGCSYRPGTIVDMAVQDGSIDDIDGPPSDARVDTPPNSVCFGSGLYVECFPTGTEPSNDETLAAGQLDTTTPSTCTRVIPQGNGPELCLRMAGTFTVSGYIRFRGARPLVLLATTTITVLPEGTLDVSSFRNDVGAGGNTGECAAAIAGLPNLSLSLTAGAGGGGGAGFGTPGGNGAAPNGGAGAGTTALTQIRGGCKGASGGTSSGGAGGEGGNGGGAVYMIAGTSITVDGKVMANGAGGSGGPNKAGGGGGGSGGFVGLDAPELAISGTVFANGGGAGEGGGGNRYGENGKDPTVYDARALGGSNNTFGGDGGNGSVLANAGTAGAADTNGGGGGGGGAGRIKVFQAIAPIGKISPPAN